MLYKNMNVYCKMFLFDWLIFVVKIVDVCLVVKLCLLCFFFMCALKRLWLSLLI